MLGRQLLAHGRSLPGRFHLSTFPEQLCTFSSNQQGSATLFILSIKIAIHHEIKTIFQDSNHVPLLTAPGVRGGGRRVWCVNIGIPAYHSKWFNQWYCWLSCIRMFDTSFHPAQLPLGNQIFSSLHNNKIKKVMYVYACCPQCNTYSEKIAYAVSCDCTFVVEFDDYVIEINTTIFMSHSEKSCFLCNPYWNVNPVNKWYFA